MLYKFRYYDISINKGKFTYLQDNFINKLTISNKNIKLIFKFK